MGLRQLRHALPRLPVARRGARRLGADRRRGARPGAHRLLPDGRAARPLGPRRGLGASSAASPRSAGCGSARSTRTSSATTPTGSAASATPTRRSARQAIAHCLECVEIAAEVGSTRDQPLARRRHELPGSGRPPRPLRAAWATSLEALYAALPAGMRLLVEYKFFEPAFYSTDLPDWGTAALICRRLGPQAQVLVDTGHHPRGRMSSRSSRSCWPRACSAASTSTAASTPTTT